MIIRSLAGTLSPGAVNGRLTILIFHRVHAVPDPLFPGEPDVRRFQAVIAWMRQWFQVLPLDVAARQLVMGTLPARAAAITFDDGYADNVTQALPVLRHYGVPATFFISTGFLDGGRMWNDSVIEAIRHTRHLHLDLRCYGLGLLPLHTLAQRQSAIATLLGCIKYLAPERRLQAVEQVVAAAESALPRQLMLRSEQLLTLRDNGMQIGAHTVSHPILEQIGDLHARWEILHSKRTLENILAMPVTLFAYPNGKPGKDYSARHVAMVRKAGFEAAVSTAKGCATVADDPLQLARHTPWDHSRWRFGLSLLRNLRQGAAASAVA